ncbi:MAG: bifunctional phosphopantothenoylcysteine decarboxylase/phosphopantothenate--cysteine ligase CoaBC [Cenarchaeum sp. SB0665_bin_23]|nr:bifunctional phosphopantothenoylcysteine decarboxylase/phosphopantothenate--cysteine ligase CoaBC [Cenarchaeum sp. SB0667_bin_13]MXY37829.1 bifunctional phosphopantothenoylcysteine decarboxylase/phosphopantothenate--cysteine ligase CoaBC [Cenarchaeum sp. SB0664_bin_35]MXY61360.1 bifunctional phosphopantothenoylcysteine decarboxylase/phosphopantothenate--cysteine ligase CoaBC [Cenarchaeum sp. SB0665_bin_23]MXZ93298.1 bifunctional phosphopantothenoylcysteine decarboxylase/phosphopantothenate--c
MSKRHPSLDITGTEGTELEGKRVAICVTGSVAAYRAIEASRLLMRHGAQVQCILSPSAAKLITPAYFTWATGNSTMSSLSGNMEHIELADYKKSDLIVVYPATANTIGKLANGIDDTALSTVLTTALGSDTPIIICPAMHDAIYNNVAVKRNIKFLEQSVRFLMPKILEGKAKVVEPSEVRDVVVDVLTKATRLRGRKVLVVAGPTLERIDPVRALTNMSTGMTGVLLARELILDGCDVTMVYGPGRERPPSGAKVINVTSVAEMMEATIRETKHNFDIIVMMAAAADYTPTEYNRLKIDSTQDGLNLTFRKTPKIIDQIRNAAPNSFLVGFKAEVNITEEDLIKSAREKLKDSKADMMVANDVGDGYQSDPENNKIVIVDAETHSVSGRKKKQDIVKFMKEKIEEKWAEKNSL